MARPTKDELSAREAAVGSTAKEQGRSDDEILRLINADRRARWASLVAGLSVPDALKVWELEMSTRHRSATVQIWRNHVPWITALLIVRYGEAEYYWPEAFDAEDLTRAQAWARGKVPEGVTWAQLHPVPVEG